MLDTCKAQSPHSLISLICHLLCPQKLFWRGIGTKCLNASKPFSFLVSSRNDGHNLRRPSFKFHDETRLGACSSLLSACSDLLSAFSDYLAHVHIYLAHVPICLARAQPPSCMFSSTYLPPISLPLLKFTPVS